MAKNRGVLRRQRSRAIRKKMRFLMRLGGYESVAAWTGGQLGRLHKGKIHCSCWMCRRKSYDIHAHRDAKLRESAIQQITDWTQLNECN